MLEKASFFLKNNYTYVFKFDSRRAVAERVLLVFIGEMLEFRGVGNFATETRSDFAGVLLAGMWVLSMVTGSSLVAGDELDLV